MTPCLPDVETPAHAGRRFLSVLGGLAMAGAVRIPQPRTRPEARRHPEQGLEEVSRRLCGGADGLTGAGRQAAATGSFRRSSSVAMDVP